MIKVRPDSRTPEQAQADERASRSPIPLQTLVDAVAHIVWTRDADANVAYFNRQWTDFTGATVEETLRRGTTSFIHPDDQARVVEEFEAGHARGGAFTVSYRLRRHDGVYRMHEARVVPAATSGSTVTLWVGTATDVTERERSHEEQRYLARASEILGTSLEVSRTLSDVARMVVPRLADWCAIDLLQPDGSLDRAAVQHVDPTKVELAWKLWKIMPPRRDDPRGPYGVIQRRAAELVHVTDAMLVEALPDPEMLALFRGLGLRSSISAPLLARDRALGVLTLVSAESGTVYEERDVAFAQEVARRIATAIDNAQLYEEALRARAAAEVMASEVIEQSKAVENELLRMRAEVDAARAEVAELRAATKTP